MEVHTHAHAVNAGRKKWTHYFWEFLMLFLAVFCGFLAENQREHIVEHKREKKLMHSLVEELKTDRNKLNDLWPSFDDMFSYVDSAIILLDEKELHGKEPLLAEIIFKGTFWPFHTFSVITLTQLRNAGYLRLIRNDSLANAIATYDTRLQRQAAIQLPIEHNSQLLDEELATILDHKLVGSLFQELMSADSAGVNVDYFKELKLLTYEPSILNLYKMKLKKIWVDYKVLELEYKRTYQMLTDLLEDLEQHYGTN